MEGSCALVQCPRYRTSELKQFTSISLQKRGTSPQRTTNEPPAPKQPRPGQKRNRPQAAPTPAHQPNGKHASQTGQQQQGKRTQPRQQSQRTPGKNPGPTNQRSRRTTPDQKPDGKEQENESRQHRPRKNDETRAKPPKRNNNADNTAQGFPPLSNLGRFSNDQRKARSAREKFTLAARKVT